MIDGYNTSVEWQIARTSICVLPVGSFEQHAGHLPLDTDSILAEFFARQIAEALDAALLPALHFATSLEHSGFRGSISLRPETAMHVIRDLAAEVERQGFTMMILLSAHGGNHFLVPVVRDVNRMDRPLKILLVRPGAFCDPEIARESRERGPDIHAGEWETSLMLAIRPDLVRAQRQDMPEASGEAHPLTQSDLTAFGVGHFSPGGAIGFPSQASAAKGRAIVASIRSHMLDHLRDRISRLEQQRRYAGSGGIATRQMTVEDIPSGMRLTDQAGWNQTPEDWHLFLRLTPTGCFVAVADGRVVGTVTTLNHGTRMSWISMLLVDPGFRGMGIGTRLLRRAIDSLAAGKTIALDATPSGLHLYEQQGFERAFGLDRMATEGHPWTDLALPAGVGPILPDSWIQVAQLDYLVFGADRTALLRALYQRAPDMAWQRIRDGQLVGFCLGRHGSHYHQVGPVVAETLDDAQALCQAALRELAGRPVVLDVPEFNEPFADWLRTLGLAKQRPLTRMVLGRGRRAALSGERFTRQYAIGGPELG